jgi:hypothetical protein
VVIVKVAVAVDVPVMVTGLVEPKFKVGGSIAPAGLDVTAAVSTTLPAKPARGVTATVVVLPLVAPGATVTAGPATMKPGPCTDTVTAPVPLLIKVVVPSKFTFMMNVKPLVVSVVNTGFLAAVSANMLNASVLPEVDIPSGEINAGPNTLT